MAEALQPLVGAAAKNLSANVVLKLKEEWSRELEAEIWREVLMARRHNAG